MLTEQDHDKFIAATRATVIELNSLSHPDDPKLGATLGRIEAAKAIDAAKARLIHHDGRVVTFDDERLALQAYYSLPKGARVAFRGKGDPNPVYPWNCVDM